MELINGVGEDGRRKVGIVNKTRQRPEMFNSAVEDRMIEGRKQHFNTTNTRQ